MKYKLGKILAITLVVAACGTDQAGHVAISGQPADVQEPITDEFTSPPWPENLPTSTTTTEPPPPPPPPTTTTTTTAPPPEPQVLAAPPATTAPPPPPPDDVVATSDGQATSFSYSCPRNGWDYGWTLHSFEPSQRSTACRVMLCESHIDPNVDPAIIVNRQGSSASGLWQFLDSTWRRARGLVGADQYARAKDAPPQTQTDAAAAWLEVTSWTQWECY